jgi:undecaprenyl-diphosphatase
MRGVQEASPPPLRWLAEFMTLIGRSTGYLITAVVAAAVLVALRRHWLVVFLALAMLLRTTSPFIKDLIDRPRPSPRLVDVVHTLGDPSFPSGHVLGATLLYGFLIYAAELAIPAQTLKRTVQGVLLSMILLMGYARVELGAHWPTDVAGGWLIGAVMLSGLVWLHQRVERPRDTLAPARAAATVPTD